MTNTVRTCEICDAQLPIPCSHKRKYCDKKCSDEARKRRLPFYECVCCGVKFQPKKYDRTMACSRECGFKVNGLIRELKQNGGRVWVRTKRNTPVPHNQHDVKNCLQCNEVLISARPNIKAPSFCDYKCRDAFKSKREPFDCAECGKHVVPVYGNKKRLFCSNECSSKHSRRTSKAKRKARTRGALKHERVDPFKVFDRDGWRCQICMKKTHRSKRGTIEDMAPELDHILPLSKGGDHTYANTQCTCRKCNISKGASVYGQIPMFAT